MNVTELADLLTHGVDLIRAIVDVLKDATADKITPADALAKIAEMHTKLINDRAAADKALKDKFDHGGEG